MRLNLFFRHLGAALVLTTVLAAGTATAQDTVIVLGIRSIEGDDEFARNLTGALRNAASQVEGWNVSDREVTLAQMALAHGCEEPDPICLAQMAESLEADRIIYGEVRRTSGGTTYDYSLNLHIFNNANDQIEHSVTDTIPSVRSDIDDLRDVVRGYAAALSGRPRVGTLRVTVNVPGAEVFVDDESVGTADDQGQLVVNEVQAGMRNVRVVAPGHQSFRSTVSIEPYGEATFEAELHEGADAPPGAFPTEIVLGTTFLVVAAGLAAGWIASWARVYLDLNENPRFDQYVDLAEVYAGQTGLYNDGDTFNACQYAQHPDYPVYQLRVDGMLTADEALANDARATCNDADTFEVLEFVFGFSALAFGAVGAYFIASGVMSGGSQSGSETSWQLVPSVGPDHAYLGLTGTF